MIREFWNVSKPDEICNVQFKQRASGIYNSVICINTDITVLAGRDNIVCTQGEKKKQIQEWFPVERLLKWPEPSSTWNHLVDS